VEDVTQTCIDNIIIIIKIAKRRKIVVKPIHNQIVTGMHTIKSVQCKKGNTVSEEIRI